MNTAARRIPARWMIAFAVLVGLCLAPVGLKAWLDETEARRWGEMRATVAELAREVRARDPGRPVLRGQPQPGNAWDEYEAAMSSIPTFNAIDVAAEYLRGGPTADRERALEEVNQYDSAILAIQRGSCRPLVRPPLDLESGAPSLRNWHVLGRLTVLRARFLREAGQTREAVELLLDSAQFGSDAARMSTGYNIYNGAGVLGLALDELRLLLASGHLDAAELAQLFRELGMLDQNFPSFAHLRVDNAMITGSYFLKTGSIENVLKDLLIQDKSISRWRYGYSDKLLLADAFEEELHAGRRLREAAFVPWKQAWEVSLQCTRDLRKNRNPLIRLWYDWNGDPKPHDLGRQVHAQLRLLRAAIRFLTVGDIPALEDPFGDTLRTTSSGTRAKIWSVSLDGSDDGGQGEWDPRKGKDIVLVVER